jgi:hypothetical protein
VIRNRSTTSGGAFVKGSVSDGSRFDFCTCIDRTTRGAGAANEKGINKIETFGIIGKARHRLNGVTG